MIKRIKKNACGDSGPLTGSGLLRRQFTYTKAHAAMESILCREYDCAYSELYQRMLENEYHNHTVGQRMKSVLRTPLFPADNLAVTKTKDFEHIQKIADRMGQQRKQRAVARAGRDRAVLRAAKPR